MSSENKCCYIVDIIGKHSQLYKTEILNDIKEITNIKQFIYYNYPIYLENNLLIKNINNDIKEHIWNKIINTELEEFLLIKQFLKCCNYKNLQPLLIKDNLEKNSKWTITDEIYWNLKIIE